MTPEQKYWVDRNPDWRMVAAPAGGNSYWAERGHVSPDGAFARGATCPPGHVAVGKLQIRQPGQPKPINPQDYFPAWGLHGR